MYAQHRRCAEFHRRNDIAKSLRTDFIQDDLCTLGRFMRAHQFATVQFGARTAQQVIRGENREHGFVILVLSETFAENRPHHEHETI